MKMLQCILVMDRTFLQGFVNSSLLIKMKISKFGTYKKAHKNQLTQFISEKNIKVTTEIEIIRFLQLAQIKVSSQHLHYKISLFQCI